MFTFRRARAPSVGQKRHALITAAVHGFRVDVKLSLPKTVTALRTAKRRGFVRLKRVDASQPRAANAENPRNADVMVFALRVGTDALR